MEEVSIGRSRAARAQRRAPAWRLLRTRVAGVPVVVAARAHETASRHGASRQAHRQVCALAAAELGLAPSMLTLVQRCPDCGGAHGRPVVCDRAGTPCPRLCASVSHTGGLTLVALARCSQLGVDVEERGSGSTRAHQLGDLLPGNGDALSRWTRLEAVLKADGRGLRVDPGDVVWGDGGEAAIRGEPGRFVTRAVDAGSSFAAAIAIGLEASAGLSGQLGQ